MSEKETNPVDSDVNMEKSKKLSQEDAIKRILERKQQLRNQANTRQVNPAANPKKLKTQIHKVQNNQKRRTGV